MALNAFWLNQALTTAAVMQWRYANSVTCPPLTAASKIAHLLEQCGVYHQQVIPCLTDSSSLSHSLLWAVSAYGAQVQLLNPNFSPEFIIREINHHDPSMLFVSPRFLPLLKQLRPLLINIETIVVLDEHPIVDTIHHYYSFSELSKELDDDYAWPQIDEQSAALISYEKDYKGVVQAKCYSHRQMLLTALNSSHLDAVPISSSDSIFWSLPLYEEMAWVIPLACLVMGLKVTVSNESTLLKLLPECRCFSRYFVSYDDYQQLLTEIAAVDQSPQKAEVYIAAYDVIACEYIENYVSTGTGLSDRPIFLNFNWQNLIKPEPLFQPDTIIHTKSALAQHIFPQPPLIM